MASNIEDINNTCVKIKSETRKKIFLKLCTENLCQKITIKTKANTDSNQKIIEVDKRKIEKNPDCTMH